MCKPGPPKVDKGTVVWPPPGRCIYCPNTVGLDREHVIPLALGATFIFRKASCKACAKVINEQVENPLLKFMFGPLRSRLGLHERRRPAKDRSKSRTVQMGRATPDGTRFVLTDAKDVPNEKLPLILPGLEIAGPPGILLDQGEPKGVNVSLTFVTHKKELLDFLPDGQGFGIASVSPLLFCRMLAKIAHGFAAAEIGLCNFTPLLPDLILGKQQAAFELIGGSRSPPDTTGMHKIQLEVLKAKSGRLYHSANIRLWAPYGMPDYHVIVGECR